MNSLVDREGALSHGLADIRTQFQIPSTFPEGAIAQAEAAAARPVSDHADWTDREFVTLDPQPSTDLDQAFAIERSGADVILYYAIADVGWFVRADDPLDVLSPREREVLGLMAEGRSNAGIAHQLWITEGTVEKHVRSILMKLRLPATQDDQRRVLAVITYLDAR